MPEWRYGDWKAMEVRPLRRFRLLLGLRENMEDKPFRKCSVEDDRERSSGMARYDPNDVINSILTVF
jgi:hypothetical protein